ncbi:MULTISPECIES: AMP-binding protein [Paraburkholderia]|uniref:AMP-binding protein n=1 Tax=Paraburkholderia madseniana TaxID=2599607 RepID=A0AAP5BKQ4_9BURK|nr:MULTISPECIES: AMP-binding protein [Paraburkholderia]MCX4151545.1 AMP-binding protein [Paraburkholderia madseniana]MDN7154476.1 AMP-binding protein [Paraburkholderia sp. WS6]MDQ6413358.1 AMP-binding protein [Paraburkholderia madseniana]
MTADFYCADRLIPSDELELRARRLAGGLREKNIGPGDSIAILARNHPVYADVILACRLMGCFYCPINSHLTAREIEFILEDSGSKLLIVQHELADRVPESVRFELPTLVVGGGGEQGERHYERWLQTQIEFPGSTDAPGSHIPYTAGTTGRPKGVVRLSVRSEERVAKRAMYGKLMADAFGIIPGGRVLMPAPLYHSAPSIIAQTALDVSERLVLMPRFDAQALLEAIEVHRITTLYLVPIMYSRLLAVPEDVRSRYDISSLKFVASTGAPCAPSVKRQMIEWMGPIIHEAYASSEVGAITIINSEEALRRPGSAGRPLETAEVRIMDAQGNAVPPGSTGLIYVRQLAYPDFTYRGNDEARRSIERQGLVTLGDMGHVDDEGYLYVSDRATDMVVSGGVNIYPVEVEHQLVAYPGIADCAVFGIPDSQFGEKLIAVLQLEPERNIDTNALIEWLRDRIAGFKIPRVFETVTVLPRDENGKIAKRRLREPYWASHERAI